MIFVYKGMKFDVFDNVYNPAEDTLLIADNLDANKDEKVLELGTGSGLLSILAAQNGAEVVSTDINGEAIKCAKRNARRHGVKDKIDFRRGNLFEPIKEDEKFDLVIFNPPYLPVPEEEGSDEVIEKAWDGGVDGREILDEFFEQVLSYTKSKGRFYFVQSSLTGISDTLKKLESKNLEVVKKKENYFFEKIYLFKVFLKS